MGWLILNDSWTVVSIRGYSWRILSGASQTLAYSWRIFKNVSQSKSYSWKIGAMVSNALIYTWRIKNNVFGFLSYSWSIAQYLVSSKATFISKAPVRKKIFSTREEGILKNEVKRSRFKGTK